MTVVESSPGTDVSMEWTPEPITYTLGKPLSHIFPPTTSGVRANIAEVYNGGTMEWWYVPCLSCGEYYPQNPSVQRFSWGDDPDPIIAARSAGTVCCWCGTVHTRSTKPVENAWQLGSRWRGDRLLRQDQGHLQARPYLSQLFTGRQQQLTNPAPASCKSICKRCGRPPTPATNRPSKAWSTTTLDHPMPAFT